MLKNLDIHDFRGFRRFRIPRLGRVNLLVGADDCGKTSILEAVDILTAPGDFSPIWHALHRRGEEFRGEVGPPEPPPEVDIRRLFRGHVLGAAIFSRIEKGRDEAVAYTEQEIVAVAERDIEVC